MFALFNVIFPGFETALFLFPSPDPSASSFPWQLSTVDARPSWVGLSIGLTTLMESRLTCDLLFPSPVRFDPIDSFLFRTALASIKSFVRVPFDELLLPSASVASYSCSVLDGAALPFVAVEVLPATVDLLIFAIYCINSFSSSFKSFLTLFLWRTVMLRVFLPWLYCCFARMFAFAFARERSPVLLTPPFVYWLYRFFINRMTLVRFSESSLF